VAKEVVMTDVTQRPVESDTFHMEEGDDFVCPNCGCEIRLRHHGDPAKMQRMQPFTCCCGTRMDKEQRSG
jgi:hypothetical protein